MTIKKGRFSEAFRRQGRQPGAIAYFPLKAVAAGTFTAILLVLVVPAHLPAPGAPGCPGLGKTRIDGYCRLRHDQTPPLYPHGWRHRRLPHLSVCMGDRVLGDRVLPLLRNPKSEATTRPCVCHIQKCNNRDGGQSSAFIIHPSPECPHHHHHRRRRRVQCTWPLSYIQA